MMSNTDGNSVSFEGKIIRRRIQIVGGNTVTVSLPRSWAKKNRLGKKNNEQQEVTMRHHPDGSLILSPANTNRLHIERERIHKVRSNENIETLKQIVLADFIGGIDVIKFRLSRSFPNKTLRQLRDFVDTRLIGFDMIELDQALQIINMTQSPQFDVHRLMEIIRVQSSRMVSECFSWINHDHVDVDEMTENINSWETILDRQSNQMLRTLQLSILDFWMAEKVNLPMSEILYWSTVTNAAESAADLAVMISELAPIIDQAQLKPDVRKNLYNMGKQAEDLFSRSMRSFIRRDYQEAHAVLADQAKSSLTFQKRWPIEAVDEMQSNSALVVRNLEKIDSYARRIAEATIDCGAARVAYLSSVST